MVVKTAITNPRPKCWAFGPTGKRCDHDAGHDGLHESREAWDDDGCLTFEEILALAARQLKTPPPTGGESLPALMDKWLVPIPELDEEPIQTRSVPVICAVCEHDGEMHPMRGACMSCDCRGLVTE